MRILMPEQIEKKEVRKERIYVLNDEWYFRIRSGPDQGPYLNRKEVEIGLTSFISEQKKFQLKLHAERELSNFGKFGLNTLPI